MFPKYIIKVIWDPTQLVKIGAYSAMVGVLYQETHTLRIMGNGYHFMLYVGRILYILMGRW